MRYIFTIAEFQSVIQDIQQNKFTDDGLHFKAQGKPNKLNDAAIVPFLAALRNNPSVVENFKYLYLNNHLLCQRLDLRFLTSLETLSLRRNLFHEAPLVSPSVRFLWMAENEIYNAPMLSSLPAVDSVDFTNNILRNGFIDVEDASALTRLYARNNAFETLPVPVDTQIEVCLDTANFTPAAMVLSYAAVKHCNSKLSGFKRIEKPVPQLTQANLLDHFKRMYGDWEKAYTSPGNIIKQRQRNIEQWLGSADEFVRKYYIALVALFTNPDFESIPLELIFEIFSYIAPTRDPIQREFVQFDKVFAPAKTPAKKIFTKSIEEFAIFESNPDFAVIRADSASKYSKCMLNAFTCFRNKPLIKQALAANKKMRQEMLEELECLALLDDEPIEAATSSITEALPAAKRARMHSAI